MKNAEINYIRRLLSKTLQFSLYLQLYQNITPRSRDLLCNYCILRLFTPSYSNLIQVIDGNSHSFKMYAYRIKLLNVEKLSWFLIFLPSSSNRNKLGLFVSPLHLHGFSRFKRYCSVDVKDFVVKLFISF